MKTCRRRFDGYFSVISAGNSHAPVQAFCAPLPNDLASAAAEQATSDGGSEIVNAIGPETFTYRGLVSTIRRSLGLKRLIIGLPPELGYWGCRLLGPLVHDVIITRQEIQGLMEERPYVDAPPLGTTKLSEWIEQHKDTLGRHYTSELARRTDRTSKYQLTGVF